MRLKRLIFISVTLIVLSVAGFKVYERSFYLSVVPKEFGVSKILYRKEKAWGFGPGGNETGIRVYELPEQVAQNIEQQGLKYLKNLASNVRDKGDCWRGHYSNWLETPIEVTRHWTNYMSLDEDADYSKETPSISNYMYAHGFGIEIEPGTQKLANDAIRKPGNYYAYGRTGVIIIIPEKKRIIYAYNG